MKPSQKLFATLRIVFGLVWLIDAWLKWQPAFINGFIGDMTSMVDGQPAFVQSWIHLWISIVSTNPHLFAILVAIIETIIALGLIFGLFTRTILGIGIIFSLILWSAAEGFGGPYSAGSTDIGAAIIYAFVFVALWIGNCSTVWSIDSLISKKSDRQSFWQDKQVSHVLPNISDTWKNNIIKILLLVVIVLGSFLILNYLPVASPSSDSSMGVGSMAPMGMTVKTFDIPAGQPIPTVDFDITKDPNDGWNLHIITTNFTFTPQNVNTAPVLDQGHAHLYIDGTLYVVYGPWYHIDNLSKGPHTITVSLNANDHSVFAVNGVYIQKQKTIIQD